MDKPRENTAPVTRLQNHIVAALAISVLGTAVVGGALLFILDNIWWLAVGGLASLFRAGTFLGRQCREPDPLHGAVLAVDYYGLVVGILFGGELAERLPGPLPGLSIGDSTFFFVSPLLMLAASVVGTILGGRGSGPKN